MCVDHTQEVHHQNSNLNRQLLDDDERATLFFASNLSQIHRDLTARDADSDAFTRRFSQQHPSQQRQEAHLGRTNTYH